MLLFSKAEQISTFGIQPLFVGGNKCRADIYCCFAFFAFKILSPSALLIKIVSAISIIPLLIPWSSSPAPESISNKKKSTNE